MKGTEKQIKWAQSLVKKWVGELDVEIRSARGLYQALLRKERDELIEGTQNEKAYVLIRNAQAGNVIKNLITRVKGQLIKGEGHVA